MSEHVEHTMHSHVATVREGRWVCAIAYCGKDLGVGAVIVYHEREADEVLATAS